MRLLIITLVIALTLSANAVRASDDPSLTPLLISQRATTGIHIQHAVALSEGNGLAVRGGNTAEFRASHANAARADRTLD